MLLGTLSVIASVSYLLMFIYIFIKVEKNEPFAVRLTQFAILMVLFILFLFFAMLAIYCFGVK
jgi:multisubunit Na+/H+ antiporter MnhB subunit